LNKYRFGFNGAENLNEVKGAGNTPDLGDRWHDPRLGKIIYRIDRRTAEYPWQSPYAYYANSPIWQIDYNGEGDGDKSKFEEGAEKVAVKIAKPLAVYGRKIDDFMKSAKDVGIGGQFKIELGSGAITFKAENWSTDEDNFGFSFGVEVEGKVGFKDSDLDNIKENSLFKTYKIIKEFIKSNYSSDAIKKNFKPKFEAYVFSNHQLTRKFGEGLFQTKTETEIKGTIPINTGIGLFGSSNNKGYKKIGFGSIDKPDLEGSLKYKLNYTITSNHFWFK
jgi:hypothetical protein